ncbi:MAG: TonB-dependent receptor [Erythrobacter sp.]
MNLKTKALATTGLATAILVPAVPAMAQEAAPAAEETGNVIIVTARKVEESIQEVPASIVAFTAEDLEERSITQLEDVAMQTPGLVFEDFSNGGFAQPTIRGTTQFSVASLEQNVAVFLDGVNIPRNYAFDVAATDFSRIEVVKGPQSALYGANAFSGVINYVTNERSLSEISAGASVSVSENGGLDLNGNISVPLVEDRLSLRLALGYAEFDGDYTNSHPLASAGTNPGTDEDIGGYEKESIIVGASFAPIDSLKFDFDYYRFQTNSEQRAGYRLSRGTDTNCSTATVFFAPVNQLFCGELSATPAANPSGVDGFLVDPRSYGLDAVSELIRVGAEWEITDQITASYLYGDFSGNVFSAGNSDRDPIAGTALFGQVGNVFTFLPAGEFDYETHEARLAFTADSGLYVTVGAYLQDGEDLEQVAFGFVPLGGTDPITDFPAGITPTDATTLTEKTSVFGRIEVPLLDEQLNFNLEARYTDEEITLTDSGLGAIFTRPDDYITGRASVDYAISDNHLVYISAARGIKSGGINASTFAGLLPEERFFGRESNWAYEFGIKNTLFNGAATLNAAAFYIDWENLQISRTPTGGPINSTTIIDNLAAATSKGIEFDGAWEVVDGITLNAGLAYIDATYKEGTVSATILAGGSFTALPFENPQLCDDVVCNSNGDIGGNDLQRTSDLQWNVGLSARTDLTDSLEVFGRFDLAGQSDQFVSEINTASIEARTVANARAGVRGDNWSASIWATNLFDEVYVSNAFFIANRFQVEYVPTLGNRRRVGVTLSFDY